MAPRLLGAILRALLMGLMIYLPTFMLAQLSMFIVQFTLYLALCAALLTFIEYYTSAPSIIEFRDAAPFNRLRFLGLFGLLFTFTLLTNTAQEPSLFTQTLFSLGERLGQALDFTYSPLQLFLGILPETTDPQIIANTKVFVGLGFVISLCILSLFLIWVKILNWPLRKSAFNIWINLPLFTPWGQDVVKRIQNVSKISLLVGLVFPFISPSLIKIINISFSGSESVNALILIWLISIWFYVPLYFIMRAIALQKVTQMLQVRCAKMIDEKPTQEELINFAKA